MYGTEEQVEDMRMRLSIAVGLLALLILPALNGRSLVGQVLADQSADSPIRYEIDFDQRNRNYVNITATIDCQSDELELMMPVWTPGSYLVREFARHIDSFEVFDDNGEAIPWGKVKKNRWRVESGGTESIEVRYRLYCNELTVRTNYVDGEYAVINGAATFVTVPELMGPTTCGQIGIAGRLESICHQFEGLR